MMYEINKKQRKFAVNFVFYIIVFGIVCFVGISRAFADTVNVGYLNDKTQVLVDIPTASSGAPITLPINTVNTYGNIIQIWFNVNNQALTSNTLYQFEIYTPQGKLNTNINWVSIQAENEVCEFVALVDLNTEYPKVYFKCRQSHSNGFSILLNSTSTDSITSANFRWSYTYLRYFTDEQNDIDWSAVTSNANTNANNIINNNNQNTQQIIDSNKVCNTFTINTNNVLNGFVNYNSGLFSAPSSNNQKSFYIKINPNTEYTWSGYSTSSSVGYGLFSNIPTTSSSANSYGQITSSKTFTSGSNDNYLVMFYSSDNSTINLSNFKLESCQNGNQAINDSLNSLDDTLNDDNTSEAESEASDFFSSFNTNTFGLTSIITAPLNLIRSVIGDNMTCVTLRLPLPYLNNKYLELPCMAVIYLQYFGSFFELYQTITYGIVAYWVIVRIFNQVKDFKNPEHDEIEVFDL